MEAGLTPYEAIRAGTRDAAEALQALAEVGTLAPGKRADLLLVSENPLASPSTLARPEAVVVRGRLLTAEELQSRLDDLAGRISE